MMVALVGGVLGLCAPWTQCIAPEVGRNVAGDGNWNAREAQLHRVAVQKPLRDPPEFRRMKHYLVHCFTETERTELSEYMNPGTLPRSPFLIACLNGDEALAASIDRERAKSDAAVYFVFPPKAKLRANESRALE